MTKPEGEKSFIARHPKIAAIGVLLTGSGALLGAMHESARFGEEQRSGTAASREICKGEDPEKFADVISPARVAVVKAYNTGVGCSSAKRIAQIERSSQ